MIEWELNITYGITPYSLKAVLEYHSSQIMRIRVQGKKSTLLLENNYPLVHMSKGSKKGIQWKLREGAMKEGSQQTARLLATIMEQLEYLIKKEFP